MVLSEQRGSPGARLLTAGNEPQIQSLTAKSVSTLQLIVGDHPARVDDVHPVSAELAQRRGSAVRARGRYLPRDGALLAEPVRPDVRGGSPAAAREPDAWLSSLALAP